MARRSFMSSSSRPWSSAILKTSCSTPACVSFKFSMRASSSGPKSLTVARTGWPCWPNTSQRVTGHAMDSGATSARSARTLAIFSPIFPTCEIPVRSPFTSAMNTGIPMRLKPSAMVCSVTVLPVPVAPVIKPWRLALSGRRKVSTDLFFAIKRGSAMMGLKKYNDSDLKPNPTRKT